MPDLTNTETTELVAELERRFKVLVLAAVESRRSDGGEIEENHFSTYSGGAYAALGLLRAVESEMRDDLVMGQIFAVDDAADEADG